MSVRLFLHSGSSDDGKIIPNAIMYLAAINQMRIKVQLFDPIGTYIRFQSGSA